MLNFKLHSFFCVQNVANLLQSSQKDAQLRSAFLKRNDQEAVAQHCKSHKKCRRKARAAQYSLAPFGGVLNGINLYHHHTMGGSQMAVCQNLVPLVNIKIAGKWMFIPLKMVLIGIDPYPNPNTTYPTSIS